MTGPQTTNILIQEAQAAFASLSETYRDVRFPSINGNDDPLTVPAVWTLDGTRPRWNNLAIIIGELDPAANHGLEFWRKVSTAFAPRLTALASDDQYTLLIQDDQHTSAQQTVLPANLRQTLAEKHKALFAPGRLAAIRGGQLTFADLDSVLPKDSIHFRHRVKLDEALEKALMGALQAQREATESTENQDAAVIEVAIAYLAARILADKGFFSSYPSSVNDPASLLQLTVEHKNGFFSHVISNHLRTLKGAALQKLAAHLGSSVTFALIDDRDVGHLYERSIIVLNSHAKSSTQRSLEIKIPNLQQHYTPMAIAERMLRSLPLERLRPEERIIFDPAAGSGTLLLAATKRLATMPDIHLLDAENRRDYLSSHVLGNDIDPNAALITRLRYALVQETLSETFPTPAQFTGENYEKEETWPSSPRPRVIVANPPFEKVEGEQKAVTFVEQALKHLQKGDQFAFVLPQSFLTGTFYKMRNVRQSIGDHCHILETWQLPEGVIGLKARQQTCVISGIVGERKMYSIARAIVSGAQQELIREKGFLGQAWISSVASAQWREATARVPIIRMPSILLSHLFHISTGVSIQTGVKPIAYQPQDIKVKPFWRDGWRKSYSMFADSRRIKPEERYIRYGHPWLRRQPENEDVLDSPKILATRSMNRNSKEPFAAYLDMYGFSPTGDMFCIVPKTSPEFPEVFDTMHWKILTNHERMLWLIGILNSPIAAAIIMSNRNPRHIIKEHLGSFPIPETIDRDIITLVDDIIQREQRNASEDELALLRAHLNEAVNHSYGNPYIPPQLIRTGELPEVQEWQREREEDALSVTGQVLEVNAEQNQIFLYLEGLLDEDTEAWVPLPPELPGWALDGTVFSADLSETVETFAHLRERPWALRNVRHTPTPYLSLSDIQEQLSASLKDAV